MNINETIDISKSISRASSHSEVSVLVAYGTRYGATAETAEEIARVLSNEGFEVKLVDVKKEKVKDISEYALIIVGSGMQIDRWTKESEGFLKRFHHQLKSKKLALFVSSGAQAIAESKGNPEEISRARRTYLEEKAAKYDLQPISMKVFGGVWNLHKTPWWSKMAMEEIKSACEEAHITETGPGVYDTRDWEAIRNWARELVTQVTTGMI